MWNTLTFSYVIMFDTQIDFKMHQYIMVISLKDTDTKPLIYKNLF